MALPLPRALEMYREAVSIAPAAATAQEPPASPTPAHPRHLPPALAQAVTDTTMPTGTDVTLVIPPPLPPATATSHIGAFAPFRPALPLQTSPIVYRGAAARGVPMGPGVLECPDGLGSDASPNPPPPPGQ